MRSSLPLVAEPIYAVVAVTALAGALQKLGFACKPGAAVEATMAVITKG